MLIGATAAMPDFLDPNDDPAEPMPRNLIPPVIVSSLTVENNLASSGSLNAYIIDRNKRETLPPVTIRKTQSI